MKGILYICIFTLLQLSAHLPKSLKAQGFMHAEGKKIVDQKGAPFIIRSMGIGSWMLMEGYHMKTSGIADTQNEFEEKLTKLTSKSFKDTFYRSWLSNHFNEKDLIALKELGFNSIRPALHYKWFTPPIEQEPDTEKITWRKKGFNLLDSLIEWCSTNEMYLFLDLHGAPGGQGYNASINDYDPNKPSLWESEHNKRKTAALWKKIAQRCVQEPWIGGYDLINETNWTFEGNFEQQNGKNGCHDQNNLPLRNLLEEITDSIRKVDKNHMIIIEGNCWANNFKGLTPPWDSNMVYSFHKYWNPNTVEAIKPYLNMRDKYNIPLWLGETGENSNTWFTQCIQLMESNQIGWSWWTHKQLNDIDDPYIIPTNNGYEKVLAYWKGEGDKPTARETQKAFLKLAEDAKIKNCIFHKDVIDAMFRQTKTSQTIPFKNHFFPGIVYCSDYDMGKIHHAYYDTDYTNTDFNTTTNHGGEYRNDGVDIEKCHDLPSNGFNIGWTKKGEWLNYSVEIEQTGMYLFSFRVAPGKKKGCFYLTIDDKKGGKTISVPRTNGSEKWQTIHTEAVLLYKGEHAFRINIKAGGFKLNFFEAQKVKKATINPKKFDSVKENFQITTNLVRNE